MSKVIGMDCPHCGKRAQVKASVKLTDTLRNVYFQCTNLACGHTWLARIEAVHTISPPSMLCNNPNINLPLSPQAELERIWDLVNGPEQQTTIFDIDGDDNETTK